MSSIFEGLKNIPDDEIRGQIAMMECISFSSALKEQGQKAVRFLTDTFGLFGKNQEYSEDDSTNRNSGDVRNKIDDKYNELAGYTREELNKRLKEDLTAKYNTLNGKNLNLEEEELSDIYISIMIAREAAKIYGIDPYRTPDQMCDEIAAKYYEHYLLVWQKKLQRANAYERTKWENTFQKAIPKADINRMRQLANELMLREFNGKSILTKIVVTDNIQVLQKIVDAMGLAVFDGIEGVISATYDSMLMFHRGERALMAEVIWTAVNGYGTKISLNDDMMPSFSESLLQMNEEKERKLLGYIVREKQLNQNLRNILKDIDTYNKKYVQIEQDILKNNDELKSYYEEYEKYEVEYEEAKELGNVAKINYDSYENNSTRSDNDLEYRKIKQEYENAARQVRNAEYRLNDAKKVLSRLRNTLINNEKKLKEVDTVLSAKQEELMELTREFNEIVTNLENEAAYFSLILRRKWMKAFRSLDFDNSIYENVVKSFTQRECVAIERLLTEMMLSGDANSYSYETVMDGDNSYNVTFCVVASGKIAKIIYKDNFILGIGVKNR